MNGLDTETVQSAVRSIFAERHGLNESKHNGKNQELSVRNQPQSVVLNQFE